MNFGAASTGKLQLNGQSPTVIGLSSTSTNAVVENGNGSNTAVTLTVNNGDNEVFAGTIQNGTIGANGALSINKGGAGTWTLSGTNTFTGKFTIQNGAVSVSSIGNAASSGNLKRCAPQGTGASAPLQMGFGAAPATLIYTGAGEVTNRNINLAGLAGGATIDMSGTNTPLNCPATSMPSPL